MKTQQKNKPIWKEIPLGEIAIIDSGQGAPQGDEYFTGKNIFVRAGDLNNLTEGIYVGEYCGKITEEAIKKYKLKKYKMGSVVFPKSGMSVNTGNIAILKNNSYIVNHLAVIEPNDEVNNLFLFYLLKKIGISHLSQDASYPSIRISEIKNLKIPLPHLPPTPDHPEGKPDLATQKQIVAVLEKAEKLKQKQKKVLELYDEYLKSVFWGMFLKEKGKWEEKRGDKLFELAYGKSLPEKERDGGKYPVYGSNGIVGSHSKFLVEGPGIIVGRKGSIGEVNYAEKSFWPIDTTYYIKPINKMNLIYVYYLLKSHNLKLNKSAAIPGLNRNDVYSIKFMDVPLPLQQKFANIVEKVEKLKEKQKKSLNDAEELFNALMQKAFRGELEE